jgi:DAACS family dicarboxylate/amino acid:cation (Na+ or H+) symporter
MGPRKKQPTPQPQTTRRAEAAPPPKIRFFSTSGGRFAFWHRMPLYLRILAAVVLGAICGLVLGARAAPLEIPSKLVLRLLGTLAAPLILLAVVQALMHAEIPKGSGTRLVRLLVLNTLVAIGIGLLVANIVRPGRWSKVELAPPATTQANAAAVAGGGSSKTGAAPHAGPDALTQFLDNIPKSMLGPLGDEGKVISVIILALAIGIALRRFKTEKIGTVADVVAVGFNLLILILHWIIALIPLAVFGIVASIIGTKGFAPFVGLGAFVVAVLIALALQVVYYLVRIAMGSWVRPRNAIRGMRDALMMAFSTASSTATMPVTYACLREKVGLRERSASLGALVGANFNNDGTALYEAMAALFVSQMIGVELTILQQLVVVLTSVAASVGAAGIPEAGIVTMTLVFTAVKLDVRYIPVLLTVDWFLDRCRTTVNVMGDVNVSCLLDGRTREEQTPPEPTAHAATALLEPTP